jgi:hypothetical protein
MGYLLSLQKLAVSDNVENNWSTTSFHCNFSQLSLTLCY